MQSVELEKRNRDSRENLLRTSDATRVGIGHALVDNCLSGDVYASIIRHAKTTGESAYVVTANAQHVVLLNKDLEFRSIYSEADLVIADGVSLLMAARLSGRSLRERIAGVDLFRDLCGLASADGLRVFLLGGRPGSAELAAAALQSEFSTLESMTYCPPRGFESSETELAAVAAAITRYRPHLLFVALGAPKQEKWIYNHGLRLSVPVCIGVGGSFEMVGGVVSRAPAWIQNVGCEWLYRLFREPRRMWHRYTVGNLRFAEIVAAQYLRRILLNACVRVASRNGFEAELRELTALQSEGVSPLLTLVNMQDRGNSSNSVVA